MTTRESLISSGVIRPSSAPRAPRAPSTPFEIKARRLTDDVTRAKARKALAILSGKRT